ncbi:MAG: hypothetical protein HY800_09335, partial [Ignavibacteriales bacterium]|nr:hypothetical protein [Ignavibacteriales bacterium]
WRAPKLHLAAGAFIANEVPMETILMAMMLEMYKKVRQLEQRVATEKVDYWNNGVMERCQISDV